MKPFYLLLLLVTVSASLTAQTQVRKDSLIVSDSAFTKVEIESEFPGGAAAWGRFLNANLVYPPKAVRKKVEGEVVIQFIIDKTGALSDIEAISGPELLRAAALNVIKNSPNWKPAYQHGRKVKSYKKQPIVFKLTP